MNKIYLSILLLFADLFASGQSFNGTNSSIKWESEFEFFRKAFISQDVSEMKKFISFPLENTIVWGLVEYSEKHDLQQPFTEKDFEIYHTKLFPKVFIQLLKGIKISKRKGQLEGNKILYKKNSKDYWHLYCETQGNKLYLTYLIEEDGLESSITYEFMMNKSGQIKIENITSAG